LVVRQAELPDPNRAFGQEGMLGGGKITALSELPPEKVMVRYVKTAARLNDAGPVRRASRKPKPAAQVPDYFLRVLRKNKKAFATFEEFSPSHRR
jgi:hypothetical protein